MVEPSDVRNNAQKNQYEIEVDGSLGVAAYEPRDGAIVFTHTHVPASLEGHGVASLLIKAALADIRARDQKVVPICPFVAAYLERHPEEQDLLATGAPG